MTIINISLSNSNCFCKQLARPSTVKLEATDMRRLDGTITGSESEATSALDAYYYSVFIRHTPYTLIEEWGQHGEC